MLHYFSIFKATLCKGSFDNIIKGSWTIQYHHFVKAVDLYVKSVVQWQIVCRETKSSKHRMAERKGSEKLRRFDAIIVPPPPFYEWKCTFVTTPFTGKHIPVFCV